MVQEEQESFVWGWEAKKLLKMKTEQNKTQNDMEEKEDKKNVIAKEREKKQETEGEENKGMIPDSY